MMLTVQTEKKKKLHNLKSLTVNAKRFENLLDYACDKSRTNGSKRKRFKKKKN